MKAILVIDEMPSSCNACDFNRFASTHWGCSIHSNDSVTNEMKEIIRPSWCPLKQMPESKEVEVNNVKDLMRAEYSVDGFATKIILETEKLIALGWNACLEEIEG